MKESTKERVSSKRLGKNQHSNPTIQTKRNSKALVVIRKKMKSSRDTERYQTKTLRKVGQMGKQTQKRKPKIKAVVMTWLIVLSPS